MGNKNFYITTTLPYVNSKPHIGFALEIIQADVVARLKAIQGYTVFFNTGTDEHGQKIYQKAVEEGKSPQEYTDEYAAKFDILKDKLNLTYNNFIRTTNPDHKLAAQKLWQICLDNGYIEKGLYKAKYCVGCELEKQDSDLVENKCPFHPTVDLQEIEEENYFFKFKKLEEKLLKHYEDNKDFVIPQNRLTEIKNFVKSGLTDFSISRLKSKMPWGVAVPNDEDHVMCVWFDALTNYISALGWPDDMEKFNDFWGNESDSNAIQVAGKDNLRQQASMWQAMLMAANLPPTKQIFIHGFITSGGQKISKSLGNVIDPLEYIEKYGTDALRYYLLAKVNPYDDSDFTQDKFEEVYNGDLANGLGNLVSRIAKLAERSEFEYKPNKVDFDDKVSSEIEIYRFDSALTHIWQRIKALDQEINIKEPWKLTGNELSLFLQSSINTLLGVAQNLEPFLPDTSKKIAMIFSGPKIKAAEPLFPRLG